MSESTPKDPATDVQSQGDVLTDAKEASETTPTEPSPPETTEESLFLKLKKEGNDFTLQGLPEQAIPKYEEAKTHAQTPDEQAALLHNIGFSYEKMDMKEKALEAYNGAASLKENYMKVLKRRCSLLHSLGKNVEALDDMVYLVVDDIKAKKDKFASPGGPTPEDFQSGPCRVLMEILIALTEQETKAVLEQRKNTTPPKYVVEAFLRTFYGDPISRMWKGLQPTPVDQLIASGKADDLTGYMAALRELKLKKYDDIIKLCTDEIEDPNAKEESILNARYLRATMTFIWSLSDETVDDLQKIVDSPIASMEMKSSAYLKLGMRHTSTRHPFANPEKITTISEDYSKAEEVWLGNPDVYFHGSVLLVDRAAPEQAITMLEIGINNCDPQYSILLRTFFWTLKLTIAMNEEARTEAYLEMKRLQKEFDTPECHEMVAQALLAAGGEEKQEEYNDHFDKAIAFDPTDPLFKIKKLVFRHWMGDNGTNMTDQEALDEMYQFIETEGPSNLAYYHIGQMEIMRGNTEKGLDAINKSIELSGSIHEIEARIAAKLEIQFHLRVNERLKAEGLEDLAEQMHNLTMKSFS